MYVKFLILTRFIGHKACQALLTQVIRIYAFVKETMKKLTLNISVLILSWIFLLLACSAQIPLINVDANGVALKGYDPVAYFTEGRPVKGQEKFQHEWQGAKWRFASQEYLAMFQENPEKYKPQYGGY